MDRHRVPHALRQIVEIGLVALGQDHFGQASPVSRQQLLLHAADRQHLALQRDLAGHAHAAAHRTPTEEADQRCHHGDARRRSVLRDGARRDMDVDRLLLEARRDTQLGHVRPNVREADLCGLFHDVAQLPR